MTLDQIKNLIDSQLEKSGWTVGDGGECHPNDNNEDEA